MAILGLQRRIREVGRIRMGVQVPTRSGKRAPKKLDKFRLTSPDRAVIEAVANVYGGSVTQWDNDSATQWEVFTDAVELRIALPPNPSDMAFSQHYEQWAKGFCSRRCNGQWDSVHDKACDCDPEDRTCKATTRLMVLLPDIAGLGVWRLETHGYYAAVELAGAVELIGQMAGLHSVVPARLRLDQREVRRIVGNAPKVFQFAVPVIDLDVSILGVRAIAMRVANNGELANDDVPELPSGWEPVPISAPPEVLSLESQLDAIESPKPAKPRKNAAAPLPATGRTPRKAADVDGQVCSVCGQGYGAEPLKPNPNKAQGQSRFVHRDCGSAPVEPVPPPVEDAQPVETDHGARASRAKPASPPVVGGQTMSATQHGKVMALCAKVFPAGERTGADADSWRRRNALTLCDILGIPGLASRSDLSKAQASTLIDTLVALEDGEMQWVLDGEDAAALFDVVRDETVGVADLRPEGT
jgi:hypothetical protein